MKVECHSGRLIVIPETDFENDWLFCTYKQGITHKAFVKTGASTGDRLGVMIEPVVQQIDLCPHFKPFVNGKACCPKCVAEEIV